MSALADAGLPLVVDQVKQQLRHRIGSQWRPGQRLPPIDQIARQLGVGERNTYVAVKQLASEGLLVSRPRRGTYVTQRPVAADTATRADEKPRIYLPMGSEREGLLHRIARTFCETLQPHGLHVTIGDDLRQPGNIRPLSEISADALVLINELPDGSIRPPQRLLTLLTTSGGVPANLHPRYDLVAPDNVQGGELAGQLAQAFGLRDVGFIGCRARGGGYDGIDADRLRGFERGYGRALPPSRRYYVDGHSQSDGARFARAYDRMPIRPQLLFASSDDIAIGFTLGAAAMDMQPLRDYMLIGFDGQSHTRTCVVGGITTVAVPAAAMGRQAALLLRSRLDQPDQAPRQVTLACSIRRGKTTPQPVHFRHPFWKDSPYWPTPPLQGVAT
jgi:DNA-binding LacI/PurR family transcriptional regulator